MGKEYENIEADGQSSIFMVLAKIVMWIFTLAFILVTLGWYFKQDRAGKRRVWVILIVLFLLSLAWDWLLNSGLF